MIKWFTIVPLFVTSEGLGEDRVRDQRHLSGKFRCVAHEVCNLKYKDPTFFPVVFHNLSGYASRPLLKHWEITNQIFILYQIMKKTTFRLRNRSSLTNLLIRKEKG